MRSEVMSESVKNVVEGEQSGAGRRWAMSMLRCPVLRFRACRLPFKSLVVSLVALLLVYGALLMDQAQSPGKPSWLEFKTCSPRNNIAFLKTHKCASSAIQNILLRYGDNHDLNFALPNVANYFGSGRRIFEAGMVWSSPFNKVTPNIFAIHTKWNYEEEKAGGLTLDEYVKQNPIDTKRTLGYLGYNQMTWDLGTPLQDMSNLTVAHELVQRTDAQFGLVLVAERMDESLVLLAKYLCWELRDVLVLKVNSLRDEFKSSISEESRKALQQRLAPDYLLYNHFLERFDQQVEAFGRRRMAAEVARLRELMALLVTTCNFVRKEASDLTGRQKPWSNKVDGFQVGETAGGCAPYAFGELYFLDVLRKKQQKYIAKKFGLPPGPPMGAIPLGAQEIKELNPKRAQRFPSDEKRKGGKLSTVRGQG